MKLSVILVNYNVCHFLDQALGSVKNAMENVDGEIIVVDNNSVDDSLEMVSSKYPEVILIENKKNLGFSKANNLGIKMARGEYVLLLNPDTLVEEKTFEKCIDFMDNHPDGGGLGVMMLDGKGDFLPESKRGLPSPSVAFFKIFGLASIFPKSRKFGRYHLGFLDKNKTHQVEILSGAFMFMRKSVLDEIGLLDEDYFMYGEDIDLSYRIIKGGYKNFYFPETRIIHYKGESTKKTSINYVFIFYKAMIIFAQKHFSHKNAWLFSFLINIAIYIRAAIALSFRAIKKLTLPLIDGALIFAGMYALKSWWEIFYFNKEDYYPAQFMYFVVPVYILTWLISVYYSGGYNRPLKIWDVFKGILIGTLFISAFSNFLDPYRFSRAMIVFGGGVAFALLTASRLFYHFLKFKNFNLGTARKKNIAIVGKGSESRRVIEILNEANYENLQVVGYVSPVKQDKKDKLNLGYISQISEIINIHKVDEIIFCSKDIAANRIIEWMTKIDNKLLDFKIVPDESNYIIGSNSKNRPGEFYTVNIELNIIQKSSLRKKRIFDLAAASFLFLISPLAIFLVESPKGFYNNIFSVIGGARTWVGFTNSEEVSLPKIKQGIIHPVSYLKNKKLDTQTIYKLNFKYAKEYSLLMDCELMLKSFRYLG